MWLPDFRDFQPEVAGEPFLQYTIAAVDLKTFAAVDLKTLGSCDTGRRSLHSLSLSIQRDRSTRSGLSLQFNYVENGLTAFVTPNPHSQNTDIVVGYMRGSNDCTCCVGWYRDPHYGGCRSVQVYILHTTLQQIICYVIKSLLKQAGSDFKCSTDSLGEILSLRRICEVCRHELQVTEITLESACATPEIVLLEQGPGSAKLFRSLASQE